MANAIQIYLLTFEIVVFRCENYLYTAGKFFHAYTAHMCKQ